MIEINLAVFKVGNTYYCVCILPFILGVDKTIYIYSSLIFCKVNSMSYSAITLKIRLFTQLTVLSQVEFLYQFEQRFRSLVTTFDR